MGFLFLAAVAALLSYGVVCLLYVQKTDPTKRASPARFAFTLVGATFGLMFLWGILVPRFGDIRIPLGHFAFPVWGIGLVGLFIWTVAGWRLRG
jgi:hypothetical protein